MTSSSHRDAHGDVLNARASREDCDDSNDEDKNDETEASDDDQTDVDVIEALVTDVRVSAHAAASRKHEKQCKKCKLDSQPLTCR